MRSPGKSCFTACCLTTPRRTSKGSVAVLGLSIYDSIADGRTSASDCIVNVMLKEARSVSLYNLGKITWSDACLQIKHITTNILLTAADIMEGLDEAEATCNLSADPSGAASSSPLSSVPQPIACGCENQLHFFRRGHGISERSVGPRAMRKRSDTHRKCRLV